jgi:caa(3)-type oxidase subunit IV
MSDTHSHSTTGDHGGHDHHPVDLAKSVRVYLKVGATLILFTFITWLVAYYVDLGDKHLNIALGLLIASFKVSLVCLIFMHLNHERGLIYKVLLFAMVFFGAMMFLFILAYKDPIYNSFLHS